MILEDRIQVCHEIEENDRAERDERSKLDKRLSEAGDRIGICDVRRDSNCSNTVATSSNTPDFSTTPVAVRAISAGKEAFLERFR